MLVRGIITADFVKPAGKPSEKFPNPQPQRIITITEVPEKAEDGEFTFRELINIKAGDNVPKQCAGKWAVFALLEYATYSDGGGAFKAELIKLDGVNLARPSQAVAPGSPEPAKPVTGAK